MNNIWRKIKVYRVLTIVLYFFIGVGIVLFFYRDAQLVSAFISKFKYALLIVFGIFLLLYTIFSYSLECPNCHDFLTVSGFRWTIGFIPFINDQKCPHCKFRLKNGS